MVVVVVIVIEVCNREEEGAEDGTALPVPPSPDAEGNGDDAVFGPSKIFGGIHLRCRKFLDTLIPVLVTTSNQLS
jgi:hypothetical protein